MDGCWSSLEGPRHNKPGEKCHTHNAGCSVLIVLSFRALACGFCYTCLDADDVGKKKKKLRVGILEMEGQENEVQGNVAKHVEQAGRSS